MRRAPLENGVMRPTHRESLEGLLTWHTLLCVAQVRLGAGLRRCGAGPSV